MNRIRDFFKERGAVVAIWLLVPLVTIINFSHHKWVRPESVIEWDIKSYYAYLPAYFIHKDISLDFISENPKEYTKWFWPTITGTGKKCIVTSMGLSILYAPFFFIGHIIASFSTYSNDGYSVPYAFVLTFSALFYLILGLIYLRKLLRSFFDELTSLITIALIFAGTNLLFYVSWAAPMPHCYNFSLISIFLYKVNNWYKNPTRMKVIVLGLLAGLIVLIRPTNILILIVFLFWDLSSVKDITTRIKFLFLKYKMMLLMLASFILVWIPQFIYWKYVSGKFLYFSYGNLGAGFNWANPQLLDILLSFRKGWYVYTPIMFVSSLGIALMYRNMKNYYLPVLLFMLMNIYVQASWWCWWFGGSFGNRAFIDSYGIMALPLASIIYSAKKSYQKFLPLLALLAILGWYNTFQIKQYRRMLVHYWWMSPTAYGKSFLKTSTPKNFYETIPIPDYNKARKGIYVAKNKILRFTGYKNINLSPEEIIDAIKNDITIRPSHHKEAKKYEISVDSIITIEAWNKYERTYAIKKYIRPLLAVKIADSLKLDTAYLDKNFNGWSNLEESELDSVLQSHSLSQIKKAKF